MKKKNNKKVNLIIDKKIINLLKKCAKANKDGLLALDPIEVKLPEPVPEEMILTSTYIKTSKSFKNE